MAVDYFFVYIFFPGYQSDLFDCPKNEF